MPGKQTKRFTKNPPSSRGGKSMPRGKLPDTRNTNKGKKR